MNDREMIDLISGGLGFSDSDSGANQDGGFRLKGIDSPEYDEVGSTQSKAHLRELIAESGGASLERGEKGYHKRDLSVLRGNDGRDLNSELAKSGMVEAPLFEGDYTDEFEYANLMGGSSMGLKLDPENYARQQQVAAEARATLAARGPTTLKDPYYKQDGTLEKAVNRGIDNSQAMLYAFTDLVGQKVGSDIMQTWGTEGIERNLLEAMENPAEIQSWDDVDSLDDTWTFFVEAMGEQAPQLLGDALMAATGAGIGVVAARRGAMSAMLSELTPDARDVFETSLREATKKGATTGARAGALTSVYPQVTGETALGFHEAGIEAPDTVFLTGVAKAALEYLPLEGAIRTLAKTSGLGVKDIGKAAARVTAMAGLEGSTESAQTVLDFLAKSYHDNSDPFSEENLSELRTAFFKGAFVGGGLTAPSVLPPAYRAARAKYRSGRTEEQSDGTTQAFEEGFTEEGGQQAEAPTESQLSTGRPSSDAPIITTPEGAPSLVKQAQRVQTGEANALFVSDSDSQHLDAVLSQISNPVVVKEARGTTIFNADRADPEMISQYEMLNETVRDDARSDPAVLNYPEDKTDTARTLADGGKVAVVTQFDEDGDVVKDFAVSENKAAAALADVKANMRPTDTASITTPEAAQQARAERANRQITTPTGRQLSEQERVERDATEAAEEARWNNGEADEGLDTSMGDDGLGVFYGDEAATDTPVAGTIEGQARVEELAEEARWNNGESSEIVERSLDDAALLPFDEQLTAKEEAQKAKDDRTLEFTIPAIKSKMSGLAPTEANKKLFLELKSELNDLQREIDERRNNSRAGNFSSGMGRGAGSTGASTGLGAGLSDNEGVRSAAEGTAASDELRPNAQAGTRFDDRLGFDEQSTLGQQPDFDPQSEFANTDGFSEIEPVTVVDETQDAAEAAKTAVTNNWGDQAEGTAKQLRIKYPTQEIELFIKKTYPARPPHRLEPVHVYGFRSFPRIFDSMAEAEYAIAEAKERNPNSEFNPRVVDGEIQIERGNIDPKLAPQSDDATGHFNRFMIKAINNGFAGKRVEKTGFRTYREFMTPKSVVVPVRISNVTDMGMAINGKDPSATHQQLQSDGVLTGLAEMINRGWRMPDGKLIKDEQELFVPKNLEWLVKASKGGLTSEEKENLPSRSKTILAIGGAPVANTSSATIAGLAKLSNKRASTFEFTGKDIQGPYPKDTPLGEKYSLAGWLAGVDEINDPTGREKGAETNTPEYIDNLHTSLVELGLPPGQAYTFLDEVGLGKGTQEFDQIAGKDGIENMDGSPEEKGPRVFDEDGNPVSSGTYKGVGQKEVTSKVLDKAADTDKAARLKLATDRVHQLTYEKLFGKDTLDTSQEPATDKTNAGTTLAYQAERGRKARQWKSVLGGVNVYFGGLKKDARNRLAYAVKAVENTLKNIGLGDHVIHIIDLSDEKSVLQAVGNQVVSLDLVELANTGFNKSANTKGMTFTETEQGQVIFIRGDRSPNFESMAKVIAHEVGHGVFSRLQNDALLNNGEVFITEFNEEEGNSKQYENTAENGYNGTEEWFSDKFAAWLIKREGDATKKSSDNKTSKAMNRVFEQLRTKMRRLFNTLVGRFSYNAPFGAFMERVSKAGKYKPQAFNVKPNKAKNFTIDPLTAAIRRHSSPAGWARSTNHYLKKMMTELPKMVPFLFTADRELRSMGGVGPAIADLFAQQSSSTSSVDTKSFFPGRDNARAEWIRSWEEVVEGFGVGPLPPRTEVAARKAHFEARETRLNAALANVQQAAEKSDPRSLTRDGRTINSFMQAFNKQYLKPRIPTIGALRVFFPRMFNLEEVQSNRRVLEAVLLAHFTKLAAIEGGEGNQLDASPESVRRIVDNIINSGGGYEFNMDSIDKAQGPGFENRFARVMRDGELNSKLQAEGFLMEANAEIVTHYLSSATNRAEFERTFGDWAPFTSLMNKDIEEKIRKFISDRGLNITIDPKNLFKAINKLSDMGFVQIIRNSEHIDYSSNVHPESDSYKTYSRVIKKVPSAHEDMRKTYLNFWSSTSLLNGLISELPTQKERERATKIVEGYMGRTGLDTDPRTVAVMSWAMVYESWLTLLFSAVASIPDIAGPVLRSRSFGEGFKVLSAYVRAIKGWKDATERSKDFGLLNQRLTNLAIKESYGQSLASAKAQKWMDRLFIINGQEKLTEFSRTLAQAGGEVFLESSATKALAGDVRARRHLKELNVTAEQIQAWIDDGRESGGRDSDGKHDKARAALYQFIDESVLRPNASQRPLWANHPMAMLVWHLKSFFYAYGKVIIGGMLREAKTRHAEKNGGDIAKLGAYAAPLALGGMMMLPLAALGLELREEIQYEEEEEPSNRLDGWGYAMELVSRAGIYGPFELAMGATRFGDEAGSSVANLLGPTYQHAHKVVTGMGTVATEAGYKSDQALWGAIKRSTPIINQVPKLANWMKEEVGL